MGLSSLNESGLGSGLGYLGGGVDRIIRNLLSDPSYQLDYYDKDILMGAIAFLESAQKGYKLAFESGNEIPPDATECASSLCLVAEALPPSANATVPLEARALSKNLESFRSLLQEILDRNKCKPKKALATKVGKLFLRLACANEWRNCSGFWSDVDDSSALADALSR